MIIYLLLCFLALCCGIIGGGPRGGRRSAPIAAEQDGDNFTAPDPKVAVVQLFVKILGPSISVQVSPESTIKDAVCSAMSKTNYRIWRMDFCIVYGNRSLDWEKSIVAENIQRDSTIKVIPRMRAGYQPPALPASSECIFTYTTLDDHIIKGGEFFEERIVPAALIGGSTVIRKGRSVKGQEYILTELGIWTFRKLFEMVYLFHKRGQCLVGSFTYKDIRYMPLTGSYFIDPDRLGIKKVKFTPDGYEKDIRALGQVLQRVCNLKFKSSLGEGIYPAYVAHLLGIMKSMPAGANKSDTFKEFLRNHPCMFLPNERTGLIVQVHRRINKYQPIDLRKKMTSRLGRYNNWGIIAEMVPAFEAVYNYRGQRYSEDNMSWFNFCRNFISHPPGKEVSFFGKTEKECPDFTEEDADLALLYHFDEHLAEVLCLLACPDRFTASFEIGFFQLARR